MHDPVFPKAQVSAIRLLLQKGGVLCYHRDADGTTSAAQLLKAFPGFEPHALESPALDPGVRKIILEKKPGLVVFVDLAIDQDAKALAQLRKATGARLLLIDHHPIVKDLNSRAVLHFNSHFRTQAYLPASYLVWQLLARMRKPASPWIAAIGTYADYGSKECPDVIRAAARSGASWDDVVAGAELVTSAITAKGNDGAKHALKALTTAKSYGEFARDEKLQQWRTAVNAELEKILSAAERTPAIGGLRIVTLTSKFNLVSLVSTILSERHPEEALIVRKKGEKGWKLSLRNQAGRVDVGALARKATRGIGRGGGHAKAAGALVSDWDLFEKRFRAQLAKHRKP
ncbi:MAG TPA: DHHA1 domain-containing protein [archaeon]|nr:DHHA1 domain-containing protein [archaeon]